MVRIMDNKVWFRNARFGMMVHWGLYSLLAGEYDSRRTDVNAEWIMATHKIPIKVYEKLTRAFNPVFFDPEEWVLPAKNAGMKYLVITAKHHDGFAMYGSEADDYNVVDRTPFGRDVIAEVANACRKHDMRLGLYYSQEIDWHEKDGGLFCRNSWDFPDESGWDFSRCFEKKIKPQVKELVTKFDYLLLIWFDTPKCITPGQSDELYRLVKSYQPDCLINSRIGNGRGDYTSCSDNKLPEDTKTGLWECPCTMNSSWGFKYYDDSFKSAEQILGIKEHLNSRGVNYLLNVGPDSFGRIPEPSVRILRQLSGK